MTDTNVLVDWNGKKKVNLALQGGGSHGAFTWGVLDYLLADARLDIEAITGTSAGAMNAVVLAEGYLEGGRAKKSREILEIDQRRETYDSIGREGTLDLRMAYS